MAEKIATLNLNYFSKREVRSRIIEYCYKAAFVASLFRKFFESKVSILLAICLSAQNAKMFCSCLPFGEVWGVLFHLKEILEEKGICIC